MCLFGASAGRPSSVFGVRISSECKRDNSAREVHVRSEDLITPIITAGKNDVEEPRQIPLDDHVVARLDWYISDLNIKLWRGSPSNTSIGLTNKGTPVWS